MRSGGGEEVRREGGEEWRSGGGEEARSCENIPSCLKAADPAAGRQSDASLHREDLWDSQTIIQQIDPVRKLN